MFIPEAHAMRFRDARTGHAPCLYPATNVPAGFYHAWRKGAIGNGCKPVWQYIPKGTGIGTATDGGNGRDQAENQCRAKGKNQFPDAGRVLSQKYFVMSRLSVVPARNMVGETTETANVPALFPDWLPPYGNVVTKAWERRSQSAGTPLPRHGIRTTKAWKHIRQTTGDRWMMKDN